jgi:hypothetical protein
MEARRAKERQKRGFIRMVQVAGLSALKTP